MDFGKLHSVDRIDFTLPLDDPKNAARLGLSLENEREGEVRRKPRVWIGGPVWSCPQWLGKVYPKGTKPAGYLEAYGRQFNAVELNATFYRIPSVAQVETWARAVPDDFVFSPKLHQTISHVRDVELAKARLKEFWSNVGHFGSKLGLCFLQLPPNFTIQEGELLKKLVAEVPQPEGLAIEFRHPSWFVDQKIHPKVFDYLRAHRITSIITDVAGRRDVLHGSLTSSKAFIRFTGNELHPSDLTRIASWVERVSSWIARGLEDVYFFVHQPTEAEVPELARLFADGIYERTGVVARTWSAQQMELL